MSAGPNIPGFADFVTAMMAPPNPPFDPATSPYVPFAFDSAIQMVNTNLQCVPMNGNFNTNWSIYSLAVYNLAADYLIQFAQDGATDPIYKDGLKYWQWMRKQFGVYNFTPGVVTSSGDQGTAATIAVSEQMM